MGEGEKALSYCETTPYSDSVLAFQAHSVRNHIQKCFEARKVNEWDAILKETQSAISLGADSSPQVGVISLSLLQDLSSPCFSILINEWLCYKLLQVYALQTEALLKLFRQQEACATYEKMPKFSLNWCTKLFGLARSAYPFMIGALVYLAAGRLVKNILFISS